MNIAILIPELSYGGAQRAAQVIGNYYSDNGHSVCYMLFDENEKTAYTIKGEVIYTGIPIYEPIDYTSTLRLLKAAAKLRRIKSKFRIDVTISFMEYCNSLNVLSRCGDRVIVSVRTTLSARHEYESLNYQRRWIQVLYNLSDKVVAVSDYTKKDLVVNYGVKKKRIITIPNPAIRHDEFSDNSEWIYGDNAIVCMGRLDPVKQHDRIIRAFSYVKRNNKSAKLLILGDGDTRGYVEFIGRKMGVSDSVINVGFTDRIGYYLKHARLFVMASRAEGFPNVIVEAMSYGVPIVTTDSPGGCGEIVGKKKSANEIQFCEYGVLIPYIYGKAPASVELEDGEIQLGKAMQLLLEDEQLNKRYAEKSFERAQYYSENSVMAMWDNLVISNDI